MNNAIRFTAVSLAIAVVGTLAMVMAARADDSVIEWRLRGPAFSIPLG